MKHVCVIFWDKALIDTNEVKPQPCNRLPYKLHLLIHDGAKILHRNRAAYNSQEHFQKDHQQYWLWAVNCAGMSCSREEMNRTPLFLIFLYNHSLGFDIKKSTNRSPHGMPWSMACTIGDKSSGCVSDNECCSSTCQLLKTTLEAAKVSLTFFSLTCAI